MTHTLRVALTALTLLVPLSAAAYTSPEQYLYEDDYNLPPPTARHAYERVQAQNALYAQRRQQSSLQATTTTAWWASSSSSAIPWWSTNDPGRTHTYGSTGTWYAQPSVNATLGTLVHSVDKLTDTVEDLHADVVRNARVAKRVDNYDDRNWIDQGDWVNTAYVDERGNPIGYARTWNGDGIHHGAPLHPVHHLPSSGAGTWIMAGLFAAAGYWTLRRTRAFEVA